MKIPTNEEIQAYFRARGIYCLYCGSKDIKSLPDLHPVKGGFYQRMDCSNCGRHWANYLKLSGIGVPTEKEEGERKDNSERGNRA